MRLTFFLVSLVAMMAPSMAAETLFAPKHVAQLRYAASPAISPDGQYIAYGLSVPRDPLNATDGPNWVELHVVDRDAGTGPLSVAKST